MPAAYWSGTPLRTVLVGVTDVQTILDTLVTQITVTLPAAERWTSLGSGVYKNVPDSAGAFMTIELIRDTATRLSVLVKDHLARTVKDGSHVIASGDNVYCYSGPNHMALQTNPGIANGKAFWVSMIDLAPEPADTHSVRVVAHLEFDAAGSVSGFDTTGDAATISLFSGASLQSANAIELIGDQSAFPPFRLKSVDGAEMRTYVPVRAASPTAAADRHAGIAHQMAFVDNLIAFRTIAAVGIDVGVNGRFEVLDIRNYTVMASNLAVRIPDA